MKAFEIIDEGKGFSTIKDVPIFKMHDDRGFRCNDDWMIEAVQNHDRLKKEGYRPPIIVGHNRKGGEEKEASGFLDNLVIKGKMLYADLVRVPKKLKEKIVQNAFPNRSVEILPKSKRILCMALLGGTTPHFALPQMLYENAEKSKWYTYRRINMLTEAMKQEIYELVGQAVGATIPEVLAQYMDVDDDANDYEDEVIEDGESYAIPAGVGRAWQSSKGVISKKLAAARAARAAMGAGARTAGSAAAKHAKAAKEASLRHVRGVIRRHPITTAVSATAGGYLDGRAANTVKDKTKKGYSINEDSGEVMYDGVPLGIVMSYEALAEAGMSVPTVTQHPEELPSIEAGNPMLRISAEDVGIGSGDDDELSVDVSELDSDLVDGVDREESDQFMAELEAQNYDLHQRLATVETANALINEGRRAELYEQWLYEQKQLGTPVGDITKTVAYMMTQDAGAVEQFKQVLLEQPKVFLGSTDASAQFENIDEAKIKADFNANRQMYKSLGVTEKDLQYSKHIRVNRGANEIATTY